MMKRENRRLEENEENQAGGNWERRKNRQMVGGAGELGRAGGGGWRLAK